MKDPAAQFLENVEKDFAEIEGQNRNFFRKISASGALEPNKCPIVKSRKFTQLKGAE